MLLAIDIGNTNVKLGLFDGVQLQNHFIANDLNEIKNYLDNKTITEIAVSSVVPTKTLEILHGISLDNLIQFIISNDSNFHLKVNYKSPETLGIDRLCSCEGAYSQLGYKLGLRSYLVTIDFGTATTINIVKPPGIFIGGVIVPGVYTMIESLKNKTSQLPSISTDDYKSIVGDNTSSSIASGVIHSTIGLINEAMNHLNKLDNCDNIIVYITGGMAKKIKNFLNTDFIYDEFLVLKGIRSVHDLNKN